ncbi:MAG: Uma2 family endonuclease [Chloroflexota bacterium]|nr:Uma2 family endonuclease [Dehalococcoidia bacterium]MDW8254532.1 Uma2 family endonuclease [Chloroflexota bacterium]
MVLQVPVPAIAVPALPAGPTSFEEFLQLDTGELKAEWVEGEVIVLTPLHDAHSAIQTILPGLMWLFVETRRLGIVRTEMTVRLGSTARAPDLLSLSTANRSRLRRSFVDGPPDLIVEIVLPDSIERDRVTKLREYEAAGVQE